MLRPIPFLVARFNAIVCAALFTAVISQPSVAADKANDTVIEKLQGRWEIVAGVNQGREMSETETEGTYVTVTTNSIVTYDRDQQQRFHAVFRIDQSKDPIHITMTPVAKNAPTGAAGEADSREQPSALGILQFDGKNKWVLCYALPGSDRPTKFESIKGSKHMLFKLQKEQGDPVPDVLKHDPAK